MNICLCKSVKILWKNDRWSILNSHWEYEIGVLAIQRIYTIIGVDFYRLINHLIYLSLSLSLSLSLYLSIIQSIYQTISLSLSIYQTITLSLKKKSIYPFLSFFTLSLMDHSNMPKLTKRAIHSIETTDGPTVEPTLNIESFAFNNIKFYYRNRKPVERCSEFIPFQKGVWSNRTTLNQYKLTATMSDALFFSWTYNISWLSVVLRMPKLLNIL